ncbi:MAG TPA: XkdF-like putative serine protease domain-containing protein [Vineibacter sp.]|nr:XkdF-like putative serine protease domain-containing protein [Vineibacter sp.]
MPSLADDGTRTLVERRRDRMRDPPSDTFAKASLFKYDASLGLVFGWALVSKIDGEDHFDLQGDNVTEDAMLKAAADFMQHSRAAKVMHQGESVGSVVFCWPMTGDIAKAMGIATRQTGLMVAVKPGRDVIDKFKSGEFTGFSIGGRRIRDQEVAA